MLCIAEGWAKALSTRGETDSERWGRSVLSCEQLEKGDELQVYGGCHISVASMVVQGGCPRLKVCPQLASTCVPAIQQTGTQCRKRKHDVTTSRCCPSQCFRPHTDQGRMPARCSRALAYLQDSVPVHLPMLDQQSHPPTLASFSLSNLRFCSAKLNSASGTGTGGAFGAGAPCPRPLPCACCCTGCLIPGGAAGTAVGTKNQ